MNFKQTIAGQNKKWSLLEKIGEGDAGEVYRVESFLEARPAILKRPRKSAFPSDVLRQASQIKNEGKLLSALSDITYPQKGTLTTTPALLDQSPPESGLGAGLFIVIEQAPGFDLQSLLRLARSGQIEEFRSLPGEENDYFLRHVAELGKIPEAILVHVLYATIDLLETIHFSEVWNEGSRQSGLIWNDIKPEHLYWEPGASRLTVIDWGNADFLEADGITKDRQHSAIDDYQQLLVTMGTFLSEASPDLLARLEWPQEVIPGKTYTDGLKMLKNRLAAMQKQIHAQSRQLRQDESSLYQISRPTLEHLSQIDDIHRQIVVLGEMPDFSSAVNFHARAAMHTAAEESLTVFQQICKKTAALPTANREKWTLLADIAAIHQPQYASASQMNADAFYGALAAGIADDWPSLLWGIFSMIGDSTLPDWWENIAHGVRRVYLKLGEETLTPDVTIRRLYYTLQTAVLEKGDREQAFTSEESGGTAQELEALQNILKIFDEEVVKKWVQVQPSPPNSGVSYADIDGLIDSIDSLLPGTRENLEKALSQPRAQATIVLDAWERRDFETARQALRRLLLWDPYRRRLLQADRALERAPQWLSAVRNGSKNDEPFYDYLISMELAGRHLRNEVGGALWLDQILDVLKRLRKGGRAADLVIDNAAISSEIPWLNEFRSREILSLPAGRVLSLERDPSAPGQVKTISGEVEGRLGPDLDMTLEAPLDTWAPEARGSSARVFAGHLRSRIGKLVPLAIKLMRPDRSDYSLPLFKEEAHILSLLRDVPGMTPCVEYGFVQLEEGMNLPGDESHSSASHLRGSLVRYGVDEVQNFLVSLEQRLDRGWIPYLALVKRDQKHNLLVYCDAGYTRGWFLPLRESLLLSIQICDILQIAHDRNIAYLDHKILHYYWDPDIHGVAMIDWNIAKRQPQGLSDAERQFDLVQFGARALHHIITGRPAPGALPLGPNQPEEIAQALLSYPVNWTYDDERLPQRVKEILEQVLAQGYSYTKDLRADLVQVYQQVANQAQEPVSSNSSNMDD